MANRKAPLVNVVIFVLFVACAMRAVAGDYCIGYFQGYTIQIFCGETGPIVFDNVGIYNATLTLDRCHSTGNLDAWYADGTTNPSEFNVYFPLKSQVITLYQSASTLIVLNVTHFVMTGAFMGFDLSLFASYSGDSFNLPLYQASFGNANESSCSLSPSAWCPDERVSCAWKRWPGAILGALSSIALFTTCCLCCCCFCCCCRKKHKGYVSINNESATSSTYQSQAFYPPASAPVQSPQPPSTLPPPYSYPHTLTTPSGSFRSSQRSIPPHHLISHGVYKVQDESGNV